MLHTATLLYRIHQNARFNEVVAVGLHKKVLPNSGLVVPSSVYIEQVHQPCDLVPGSNPGAKRHNDSNPGAAACAALVNPTVEQRFFPSRVRGKIFVQLWS